MYFTKIAISDGAAEMLPTLSAYLHGVLIDTMRLVGQSAAPRTRPIRILTAAEMGEACHRDIIVEFREGSPSLTIASKGQPMHIAFGPSDMMLGHALIAEAVRGGGPAIGEPASAKLMRYAARVAASEAAVLIQGDTGVGKEGMARFVHNRSARADGPFIAVNCAALPASMIEAMLFGHKRGAFTGASGESEGLFRAADGGTLFLDEITELPLELQSKLLRALQEGEVLPVGETRAIKVDIRIVAAANRNFAAEVAAGRFREDLYWRLNVMPIEIAPLGERRRDVCAIAATMLLAMQAEAESFAWIGADTLEMLMAHPFPGNVRELCNMLQRALVMREGEAITSEDFGLDRTPALAQPVAQPIALSLPRADPTPPANRVVRGRDLQSRARMAEFEAINSTLEETHGNRRQAAELLGISERTLRYRLADMRELAEAA